MAIATGEGLLRTHLACQACLAPLPDSSDGARTEPSLQFCAACASAIALEAGMRIDEALDGEDTWPGRGVAVDRGSSGSRPAFNPEVAVPSRPIRLDADPGSTVRFDAARMIATGEFEFKPPANAAPAATDLAAGVPAAAVLRMAEAAPEEPDEHRDGTRQGTEGVAVSSQARAEAVGAGPVLAPATDATQSSAESMTEDTPAARQIYRITNSQGREILVDRLEIIRRIQEGRLKPGARVCEEGSEVWQSASELKGLERYFHMTAGARVGWRQALLHNMQYPLLGWGPVIWIGCALLVWFASLAGLLVGPLLALPLVTYGICVVRGSFEGCRNLPGLPDSHDWPEILERTGLCAAVVASAVVPLGLALYAMLNAVPLGGVALPIFFLLLPLTAIYLPMGILLASTEGTVRASLDPRRVLGAILAVPGDYGRTLLLCSALSGAAALSVIALGSVPGLGGLGGAVVATYFALLQVNILGRMGRRCESALRSHLAA